MINELALFAYWPVRQKLNRVIFSTQLGLLRSLWALKGRKSLKNVV